MFADFHAEIFRAKAVTNDGFSADQIDEHVWLGDLDSASNHNALDTLKISHILTVLDFEPPVTGDDRRIRKFIRAEDLDDHDLFEEFDGAYDFINDAVSHQQNVLIHCHAGRKNTFLGANNDEVELSFLFRHVP